MLTKSALNCLLIAILPCLFTFSSCNNQTDELLNNTEFNNSKNSLLLRKKTISNYEEEYNYYGEKISLLVLEAMKDNNFRSFLKREATKEFDGDYDILLASVLDKTITKNTSLKDYFTEVAQKINVRKSNFIPTDLLDNAIKDFPLLQIALPEIYEKSTSYWKTDEKEYFVVLHPLHLSEVKDTHIEAFDQLGNKHFLSLESPPSKPTVVVGQNERVKAVSITEAKKMKEKPYYTNNYYSYFLTSDEKAIPSDNNLIERIDDDYDRDLYNTSDILEKGKFVSRQAYRQVEDWPDGRPEFKVIIVYTDKNPITGQVSANSIEKIISKDGWITRYGFWVQLSTKYMNIPVINWDKERHGLYMKYRWIEQDSGSTTQITTTLNNSYSSGSSANTSVTSTVTDNDDEAGEAIVQYEDKTKQGGTGYNTGILTFQIIQ